MKKGKQPIMSVLTNPSFMKTIHAILCAAGAIGIGLALISIRENQRSPEKDLDEITLTNLNFSNAHITNVVAELNRQLAVTFPRRPPFTIAVDITPPRFLFDPDIPQVREASAPLIEKWKARNAVIPSTLEDIPGITCQIDELPLIAFLRSFGHVQGLFPYAASNGLVLRPGPPFVECRAYRLDKTRLPALFGHADSYDPELVTAVFAGRPWETNKMVWLEDESLLIRLDTPESLKLFDAVIENSGAGAPLPDDTMHRGKTGSP